MWPCSSYSRIIVPSHSSDLITQERLRAFTFGSPAPRTDPAGHPVRSHFQSLEELKAMCHPGQACLLTVPFCALYCVSWTRRRPPAPSFGLIPPTVHEPMDPSLASRVHADLSFPWVYNLMVLERFLCSLVFPLGSRAPCWDHIFCISPTRLCWSHGSVREG